MPERWRAGGAACWSIGIVEHWGNRKLRTVVASVCLALTSALGVRLACGGEADEVTLSVVEAPGRAFAPLEPIFVTVELSNGSKAAILEPRRSRTLEAEVKDSQGRQLRYHGPPVEQGRPVPKAAGEVARVARIPPGKSKRFRYNLQYWFRIFRPGQYVALFRVRTAFLPDGETTDAPSPRYEDLFVVQSEPYRFSVSGDLVVWEAKQGPVLLRCVAHGKKTVLSALQVTPGQPGSTIILARFGELRSREELPEVKVYRKQKWERNPQRYYSDLRVGVRYESPKGPMCGFVVVKIYRGDAALQQLTQREAWPPWPSEDAWRKIRISPPLLK